MKFCVGSFAFIFIIIYKSIGSISVTLNEIIDNIDQYILLLYNTEKFLSFDEGSYEVYEASEVPESIQLNMKNISIIDLGENYDVIKEKIGDSKLFVFKADIIRADMVASQVEYKFVSVKGDQISDSSFENITVKVLKPIYEEKLDEINFTTAKLISESGYDMYLSDGPFYNDICTPFTAKQNTDIIVEERKKLYYKGFSFCEEDCRFKGVNVTLRSAICECQLSRNPSSQLKNFKEEEVSESFLKEQKKSYIKCLKCIGKKYNVQKNFNFWILLVLILLEILALAYFLLYNMKNILSKLNSKIEKSFLKEKTETNTNMMINCSRINLHNSNKSLRCVVLSARHGKRDSNLKNEIPIEVNQSRISVSKVKRKIYSEQKAIENPIKMKSKESSKFQEKNSKIFDNPSSIKVYKQPRTSSRRKSQKPPQKSSVHQLISMNISKEECGNFLKLTTSSIQSKKYTDDDLNAMSYEECIIYDRRSMWSMYYSILKVWHLAMTIGFARNSYGLRALKLSIAPTMAFLLFGFNTALLSDSFFLHYYDREGDYDLGYNISRIICSSVITISLSVGLKLLSSLQRPVHLIKNIKVYSVAKEKAYELYKCFRIRVWIFCVIEIGLSIFFFYYVTIFSFVFENTQLIILVDSLISMLIVVLLPLFVFFASAVFRFFGINREIKCLFVASQMLGYI